MREYIRQHWVAYLVGAAIAAILGFGLAYVLGIKWSTPESVRAERAAEKAAQGDASGGIDFGSTDVNSLD